MKEIVRKEMKREQIIDEAIEAARGDFRDFGIVTESIIQDAVNAALDRVGFSDDEPADRDRKSVV